MDLDLGFLMMKRETVISNDERKNKRVTRIEIERHGVLGNE
jgi:heme-binding NEAT domain protein